MSKNMISVIVPVYNVEEYLEECLNSILNQTYKNLEIILIDDGSTDKSGEICDSYEKLDKRVRVIHKVNGGLSSARNHGLKIANGEYISFVDSDDYIDIYTYEKAINCMLKYDCDIVEFKICGRGIISEKKVIEMDKNEVMYKHISSDYEYPNVAVWNKLYKGNLIKNLRFPEGKIHEDYMFQCVALKNSVKYIFLNESLYYYRIRENSITHANFSVKDFDKLNIYKERTNYIRSFDDEYLVSLSIAEEFVILFSLYWKAYIAKMDEAKKLKEELINRREEYRKAPINKKRKVIYTFFYINPKLYIVVRNLVERLSKLLKQRKNVV